MKGLRYLIQSQSQISFIAWKIRKIGEASADTAELPWKCTGCSRKHT